MVSRRSVVTYLTRVAAFAAVAAILSACDISTLCRATETAKQEAPPPQPHPYNDHYNGPFALDYLRKDACPKVIDNGKSPGESDLPSFLERAKTGTLTSILNIHCYKDAYSPRDIRKWAEEGDPVAKYLALSLAFKTESRMCREMPFIETQLRDIGASKVYHPVLKREITRVPEAYEAAFLWRSKCKLPPSDLEQKVLESGLDDSELSIVGIL